MWAAGVTRTWNGGAAFFGWSSGLIGAGGTVGIVAGPPLIEAVGPEVAYQWSLVRAPTWVRTGIALMRFWGNVVAEDSAAAAVGEKIGFVQELSWEEAGYVGW